MSTQFINIPPYTEENTEGGVTSLNSLTGDLTLAQGTGILLTPSGTTITISTTGAGGGGNVTGPSSSTQNAISTYADTTGELLLDNNITIDPSTNQIQPGSNGSTTTNLVGGDGTFTGNMFGTGCFRTVGTAPIIGGGGEAPIISAYGNFGNPRIGIVSLVANTTTITTGQNGTGLFFQMLDPTHFVLNDFVAGMRWQTTPFVAGMIGAGAYNDTLNAIPYPLIVHGGNNDDTGSAQPAGNLYLKGGLNLATGQFGGDVILSGGTAASASLTGHVYIPNVAGAPTETPQAYTGFTPFKFDTTNSKLWAYINNAWVGVTLS